jgi:hypothetical protein
LLASESGKFCLCDELVTTPPIFILPENAPPGTTFTFCGYWVFGIEIRTPIHTDISYEISTEVAFSNTTRAGEYLRLVHESTGTMTLTQMLSLGFSVQAWVTTAYSSNLPDWILTKVIP